MAVKIDLIECHVSGEYRLKFTHGHKCSGCGSNTNTGYASVVISSTYNEAEAAKCLKGLAEALDKLFKARIEKETENARNT